MNINKIDKRRKKKRPFDSVSYTTGDVDLNINRFNQAMGSAEGSEAGVGGSGPLSEAKRYVRRYYIRPQNLFASNKAEIIKALIEMGDQNCTIYTLNNLDDNKDVSKLTNRDVIYYYDDGILRDKNNVRIFDYVLNIKKEEERKKFADVNSASKREFKAEYEDRMTDATDLEESINNSLPFSQAEFETALHNANGNEIYLGRSFINEDATDYEWYAELTASDEVELTGWGYHVYTEEDGIELSETFDSVADAYEYIAGLAKEDSGHELSLTKAAKYEAFDLDFDDVNVYGEKLTESKENFCCICGEDLAGGGYNPEPYISSAKGQCCKGCHVKFVVPLAMEG